MSSPSLQLNRNIALVGSSDIILEKEDGYIIDSHKQVVRFNNAITKGYENHVGTKTDIRVSNPHVYDDHPDHHIYEVRPGSLKYREDNPFMQYELLAANYYRGALLEATNANGIPDCPTAQMISKELTVGLSFVLLCVRVGIVPSLFGFSLDMDRRGTHYWQKRESPNMVGHDQLLELKLLNELLAAEKIKVY